ncbi:GCN5-related N-acetyltransferase [Listeria floridensis FSL S10-1187]|uniref:GCN5-related N-acetyltransferase n=1 Tax=Listeria floridensis FSL S10-1187 TaxID=1265817 RepID=A0ABP3AZ33_9LIST|nr:GNAT family N-acetyltransferase [Listeria floridensis]EUJ30308.1 GCN5-related N-acetyltransferase [Listeria floridensis FSL S10-1187]
MRRATTADVRLLLPLFQNEADNFLATGNRIVEKDRIASWIESEDQEAFIVMNGEKAAAYGEIWIDDAEEDLEFAHLMTAPEFRGQGFGKQVLKGLLDEAKRYSYPFIYIRVLPENHSAIKLYQSFGFEEIEPFDEIYTWMKRKNNK